MIKTQSSLFVFDKDSHLKEVIHSNTVLYSLQEPVTQYWGLSVNNDLPDYSQEDVEDLLQDVDIEFDDEEDFDFFEGE